MTDIVFVKSVHKTACAGQAKHSMTYAYVTHYAETINCKIMQGALCNTVQTIFKMSFCPQIIVRFWGVLLIELGIAEVFFSWDMYMYMWTYTCMHVHVTR